MATKQKKIGGKRYDAIFKTVEKSKLYAVDEAIELAKKNATCKFDETIEATINLNILPKHSIRDTLSFPNSFGKEKRVVVFAQGEKADEAKNAGAIEVGFEDLISKIKGGYTDFDVAISTPDLMKEVGKLGQILGRKGLMPNPKTGTVTLDIAQTVKSFKGGRMEYRADKFGVVRMGIGKASMDANKLNENFRAFYDEILRKKPSDLKGEYIKGISVTSTVGVGISIDYKKIKL